jgi:PleD family two-component response regulator
MVKRKGVPIGPKLNVLQAAAHGIHIPTDSPVPNRVLSPNQIAKIMNVTGAAVKQWIFQRRLPAVKLSNGYWRVRACDFEAFLKAQTEACRSRVLITNTHDDRMNCVIEAIDSLGHQLVLARNFTDAILKSLDHYPALFIINLDANECEPWKLAERIRRTKAMSKFPILLVSDCEMADSDAERALKLSIQGFMRLPAEIQGLAAEIKGMLDPRETQRILRHD